VTNPGKNYFKFLIVLYVAIALLVSGYFLINTHDELVIKESIVKLGKKPELYRYQEKNYKPFEYSLLGFSVGALVIYAAYLLKKKQ